MSFRSFCFTLNNYTDDDLAYLMDKDTLEYDYIIMGLEVGKSGTPHIQGYIYYKNKKSLKVLANLLDRCHIETMKGKTAAAIHYCMKDGQFYEEGDRPIQGKRTDLDIIGKLIQHGRCTESEIRDKYYSKWCQYRRAFREHAEDIRDYDTQLVLYQDNDIRQCQEIARLMKYPHYLIEPYEEGWLIKYFTRKYKYMFLRVGSYGHINYYKNCIKKISLIDLTCHPGTDEDVLLEDAEDLEEQDTQEIKD